MFGIRQNFLLPLKRLHFASTFALGSVSLRLVSRKRRDFLLKRSFTMAEHGHGTLDGFFKLPDTTNKRSAKTIQEETNSKSKQQSAIAQVQLNDDSPVEFHDDTGPTRSVASKRESTQTVDSVNGKRKIRRVADSDSDEPEAIELVAAITSNLTSQAQHSKSVSPPIDRTDQSETDSDFEGSDEEHLDKETRKAKVVASEKEDKAATQAATKLAAIFTKKGIENGDGNGSWKAGQEVPYFALCKTFEAIEATTKRLEISEYLTRLLVKVIKLSPESLRETVYLCINRICPDYEGLELGLGESVLQKAIAESTGRTLAQIKQSFKEIGDLGKVAEGSKMRQPTMFKPKPLTVPSVFKDLKEIARTSGNASQAKKVGIIKKLLASCTGSETRYIIRSLEGKLRIGLAEKSVLNSLAHAVVIAGPESKGKVPTQEELEHGADIVKSVFSELPSYDIVVPTLLKGGVTQLRKECHITPGIPLKPMLARPTKAITEVLDRFEGQAFTCEYKYDGERAQVHRMADGKIWIFSRNSENMSIKYPDIIEQVPRCIKQGTETFVLDCEAVAWDKEAKKILPFQELSKRKRKDVKAEEIKVKAVLFAFDLLLINGKSQLQMPLRERRLKLQEHFEEKEGEFAFAKSMDGKTSEEIQIFLDTSIQDSCEGLMVKMLDGSNATYEPSRRSMNWLKLKKDYLTGIGDSLDLVVIGGYYGKGKRTNWYGAFLLAIYDADREVYSTVCKIGTGFSEEILNTFYEQLKPLELVKPRGYYDIGEAKPDIYFEPKQVWEVLTADLSLSPIYKAAAGLVDPVKGISLRFPRFIRVREDKGPEDATGPDQIAEMYRHQANASQQRGKGEYDDDY